MRIRFAGACAAAVLLCPPALAASVQVELNSIETVEGRCHITFVVENKATEALESLKLDLALFTPQRIVRRRLATELGPVSGEKTIVKTFALNGACGDVGSVLVNDVTCEPGPAEACLSGLTLSSRIDDVRLYK